MDKRLKRKFIRSKKKCPFKCSYCFAELGCYTSVSQSLSTIEFAEVKGKTIIYPSCDSELFLTDSYIESLKRLISKCDTPIISFSTKQKLCDNDLDKLFQLETELKNLDGFLKISVSISNKYMLSSIEKGTSSYEERLETVNKLQVKGIYTSVNIKPILPFISDEEYFEIVDDFGKYAEFFMLGDLYIDKTTPFGVEIIDNYSDFITTKEVSWLPNSPKWLVCQSSNKVEKIKERIKSNSAYWFSSDSSFIQHLISKGY